MTHFSRKYICKHPCGPDGRNLNTVETTALQAETFFASFSFGLLLNLQKIAVSLKTEVTKLRPAVGSGPPHVAEIKAKLQLLRKKLPFF